MPTLQVTPPRIRKRSCRLYPESGAETVEYIIVVLVAIVIGAGLLAFGNQVSGQVAKTGDSISSWFSKANGAGGTGGGNAGGGGGAADNRIDELKEKDPADWTLDDQKAVAEDIGKKGNSSELYAKAKAAMDAGTTWSIQLTDGSTLTYRIIGINHDDLADGSGKAGLTFEATNNILGTQRMNVAIWNAGGWEKSELRGRLNTGDLWALLPAELQSKAKAVTKMTDNKGNGTIDIPSGTPSATTDKVFLLSSTEIWGDFRSDDVGLQSDGVQYEYYQSKGVTKSNYSGASLSYDRWTRSVTPYNSTGFWYVDSDGAVYGGDSTDAIYVFPAWCF